MTLFLHQLKHQMILTIISKNSLICNWHFHYTSLFYQKAYTCTFKHIYLKSCFYIMFIYTYIYIYRKKERERERDTHTQHKYWQAVCFCLLVPNNLTQYLSIYLSHSQYIYIWVNLYWPSQPGLENTLTALLQRSKTPRHP